MHVSDLSGPEPADPKEAVRQADAITEVQRGFDILELVRDAWPVCKLCDLPAVVEGTRSRCCAAPIRIQGWRLPRVKREGDAT